MNDQHRFDWYDQNQLMKWHEKMARETWDYYGISDSFSIELLANRKNMQLVVLKRELKRWEKMAVYQYGKAHDFQTHRLLIRDCIFEYFVPQVEQFYEAEVTNYYLLAPKLEDDYIYTVAVKLFDRYLFRGVDSQQICAEERIVGIVASYLKEKNGRGPEKISVAILAKKFVVVVVVGLISSFIRDENLDETAKASVGQIMVRLVETAVDHACCKEFGSIQETFMEFDFENNVVISVVDLGRVAESEMKW